MNRKTCFFTVLALVLLILSPYFVNLADAFRSREPEDSISDILEMATDPFLCRKKLILRCALNQRKIGTAVLLYLEDSGGILPARLETAAKWDDRLTPESLQCPLSHAKYIFLVPGLDTKKVKAQEHFPIVVEVPSPKQYSPCALFLDGHTELLIGNFKTPEDVSAYLMEKHQLCESDRKLLPPAFLKK